MPYLWVFAGLIAAIAMLCRNDPAVLEVEMKIAFAGAGYIIDIHAQAASVNREWSSSPWSIDPPLIADALAQKYEIKQQFETVDQLLAAGGVDALVVGTPNYLHAPQTIAALNAGVHVMVEKPMAMNAQ